MGMFITAFTVAMFGARIPLRGARWYSISKSSYRGMEKW